MSISSAQRTPGQQFSAPAAERFASQGRYHIETWGCQMNVHDSEKLSGLLEREGYTRAGSPGEATVVLFNTCSIREKAAEKVFSELGRLRALKRRNPALLIGVCGCVAQQEGERIFARAPYVDFVIGPRATASLPGILASLRSDDPTTARRIDIEYRRDSIQFPFEEIRREGSSLAKAFVTIVEGCNHRCTYCIVPTTRGREVYRELDDILAEVKSLAGKGTVEVEFLGQTVNAYRDSNGRVLADLLAATAVIDKIRRIRFTTSHPSQMTDPLMDAMAATRPKLCPYLHLPVQSGSSPVLKAMRRGYDRADYLAKIASLRARIPEIRLGTDIIVGFPGESEEDFLRTMELIEQVRYDQIYSYTYSPRPGTAALELGPDLPYEVKLDRLQRLQERQRAIQEELAQDWLGREVEVLVEGPSKREPRRWTGRTPENRIVNFAGPATVGELIKVRILGASPFALYDSTTPVLA